MAAADFAILGEKHDNPDHHRLQAWAIERLVAAGRRPALAFEMVGTDQADALAAYQRDNPGTASGLGDAVGWERTGWPDWRMYEPIATVAVAAGLPVIAANLPQQDALDLARGQPPSDEQRLRLRLEETLPADLAEGLAAEIRESHCGYLPEKSIPGMALAQRARDSAMALAMVEGAARPNVDGAVLIAGSGHARTDRAVPMQVRKLSAGSSVFSLAFLEVAPDQFEPADYAEDGRRLPFDAVWFTPRIDDKDHCETLRQHMKKAR